MVHEGTVKAALFKRFLQRLLVGAKRPIFLIVDGHPTHKSKLVRTYVESTKGQLKLFFLPPYSPHLNPDEQVWAHVKRDVAKQGVEDKEQLKRLAISALRRIQNTPHWFAHSFNSPSVNTSQCDFFSKRLVNGL